MENPQNPEFRNILKTSFKQISVQQMLISWKLIEELQNGQS